MVCIQLSKYRGIRDAFLFVSVEFRTYLRLDLLPGSARGCLGSTCISLCGWKPPTYAPANFSLSLSLSLSPAFDLSVHLRFLGPREIFHLSRFPPTYPGGG